MNMKDLNCPITGANIPKLLLSAVVGFGFIFLFDGAYHGKFLMEEYAKTPDLWRAPAEMKMEWMMGSQFLLALLTALLYSRNVEGKGIMEGVRFGIYVGLVLAVSMASAYAWMPISQNLAMFWGLGGLLTGLGLGVIFSFTYKCCGTCKTKGIEKE